MRTAMAMFGALIVALAMTGVAFAHWTDTLYIDGTVNTGKLDVSIENVICWDNENVGKDYSGITCGVEGDTLKITVTNAYPCIGYYCEFKVKNEGTIPVHLYVENVGPLPENVTVTVENIDSKQVHPDEEVVGRVSIHVEQGAQENKYYSFGFKILAIQWNMEPEE